MVKQAYLLNGEAIDCNKSWVKTGRDARGHIARTLGKPSDCIEILKNSHIVEDDDILDDRDLNVVVRNPRITHVEFGPSAGSTLAQLGVAASEQVDSRLQQAGTECDIELRLSSLAVSADELYNRIACCPAVHRVLLRRLSKHQLDSTQLPILECSTSNPSVQWQSQLDSILSVRVAL